jgi:hypothetical protein
MMLSVMSWAKPPYFERLVVVIVMSMNILFSTFFTRLADQTVTTQGRSDRFTGCHFFRMASFMNQLSFITVRAIRANATFPVWIACAIVLSSVCFALSGT